MKSPLRLALAQPALRDQEAAMLEGAKPRGCSILYTLVVGQNSHPIIAAVLPRKLPNHRRALLNVMSGNLPHASSSLIVCGTPLSLAKPFRSFSISQPPARRFSGYQN